MTTDAPADVPDDFAQRIKNLRDVHGLTQTELAKKIGVSFASINRWENGQNRPRQLMWHRFTEVERELQGGAVSDITIAVAERTFAPREVEFSAHPKAVQAVAEAYRLRFGNMFSPKFASEISLIDPLPHQEIAVYDYMLKQDPLRFLLADDAGAGKTVMAGLYIREMISRGRLKRVLIVSPAGLVGNWETEMRELLRLGFRVVTGADARTGNPFTGQASDLVIVSVDTLAGGNLFSRLQDADTEPYDLVIFDEAHKLSADRQPDFTVRKTRRYRLAEALAGIDVDEHHWELSWSARHLLLLTATPHMGKDVPYYYLWRLLLPDALSTPDAFDSFPIESRRQHFIRRVKEELVHFDGTPLYPGRRSDTLIYPLSEGADGEQALYEETTHYIQNYYDLARQFNKPAVHLAMGVFQRRLASSTYALMRSLERRREKINALVDGLRRGVIREERIIGQQAELGSSADVFEYQTADDDAAVGGVEQVEDFEDKVLGGIAGVTPEELEEELSIVDGLLLRARKLYGRGEDSKFQKLLEAMQDQEYADEKFIIFTEHRDTAEFIVRRLGSLGYTDRVALLHGGMSYRERERQVNFFRNLPDEGGALVMVGTDAAGEGINLQWCWLMVNYDIPWNPARLEQRLGRIHRYGQSHDPVVVVNLVARSTREGRVLKVLLDKLDLIRTQLDSDKVFDVVGRMFEGISIKEHLEQMVLDDNVDPLIANIEETLTAQRVQKIESMEQDLFRADDDMQQELERLDAQSDIEHYRQLLPGYARLFVQECLPLLGLRIEGDFETTFRLVPNRPGALDPLLPVLEMYCEESRNRLTVYRPNKDDESVWVRPGEPIFDRISALVVERFGIDGLRGAVFVDSYANQPYLFHLASVKVEQHQESGSPRRVESRLVGLRQYVDGKIEQCSVEHLLLLRGVPGYPPSRERIALSSRQLVPDAEIYVRNNVAENLAQAHQQRLTDDLSERLGFVSRGFDYQAAELAAARARLTRQSREGSIKASEELFKLRQRQRALSQVREMRLDSILAEPGSIRIGATETLVHALVVPSRSPGDRDQYDEKVERVAVEVATAYEMRSNAEVQDVSRPELARRAGLTDWPGFDLLSRRPGNGDNHTQELAIEVKGRAVRGSIEMSDNEWARACNLRDGYWLYVVFDCATDNPQLVRVRDPFGKLLARSRESTAFTITQAALMAAAE